MFYTREFQISLYSDTYYIFISTASDSYSTKFDSCHLPFGGLTLSGTWEVRNHYLKLRPEMAILEIFKKFQLIMSMDEPQSKAQKKQHQKIQSVICNFLESVKDDVMASLLSCG
jgi:hypothetical protein